MSVPATQAQELVARYAALLDDASQHLDETVLLGILAETKRLLPSARPIDRGRLHMLRGVVYTRLQRHQDSLHEHKLARMLDPTEADHANNIAAALLNLGRAEEALEYLRQARAQQPTPQLKLLIALNEAEAYARLGETRAAFTAFEQAVALASARSASDAFSLALAAAELGADHEAVEFFARYLALVQGVALGDEDAVDFVRRAPDALWARARALPALHGALARVLAQDDDPAPEAMQVRNRIVLGPDAIEMVDRLLEHPPAPTDALRRLMQS